jgi:NAD(P)-dependent dehydrogenase (short-subunit alcohol dehydrogenase family)
MSEKRLALVTGGNRGLGLETCRQLAQKGFQVLLASRDLMIGEKKAHELQAEGLDVHSFQLDVADPNSIKRIYDEIRNRWNRLEVLVNNAGILIDQEQESTEVHHLEDLFRLHRENILHTFQVNVLGAFELCDRFGLLMQEQRYGRIVNVSSGLGQLSQMQDGFTAYRISKAALNAVTRIFASKFKDYDVLVNSICPGWVKTDMGGPQAPRSIEEGVLGIIWAATLPENGPTGGFFRDGKLIEW